MYLWWFLQLNRVVPSRSDHWIRLFRGSNIDWNKLALDSNFLPILYFTNAGIFKLLHEVILWYLLLNLIVGDEFNIVFLILCLEAYHWICVVLQRCKLILIKLALLNIIESNYVIWFKIWYYSLNRILFGQIYNWCRTSC